MQPETEREMAPSIQDLTPLWVRKSPPWILSGIIHLALMLIATTVVFIEPPARAMEKGIRISSMPPTDWEDETLPPDFEKRPRIEFHDPVPAPVIPLDEEEPIVETPRGDPDELTDKLIENDHGLSDAIGPGGRRPGKYGDPRSLFRGRVERVGGDKGGTPPILAGQQWLVDHQSPDGSWDCDGFQEQCKKNKCSGPGFEGYDVGVTALAVLAFAGTGQTPWYGKHKGTVRKAVRYLISQQDADGAIGRTDAEGWMYNHAIATMALCEIRAMAGGHAHTLRVPTDRAVDFCLRAQNPGNAWRYEPRSGDNDTSVTGWVILALKAARMADMHVPKESFVSARSYFDRVTFRDRSAGYRPGSPGSSFIPAQEGKYDPVPTMTAVTTLCRRLAGQKSNDRVIREGTEILLDSLPDPSPRMVNHYYWYYGTYAVFQATRSPRDLRWKMWQRALLDALLPTQRQAKEEDECGSWDPNGEWGIAGGRVYSTAINLLTLEVNYRYERLR